MQGETLFHCHRDNDAEVLRRETVRFSKSGSGGRLLLGKKTGLTLINHQETWELFKY